ncbi:MAG TPA: Tad domain-containing protein [Acidimicrobiia bacterium]|nr:Tad domain-containing protein [Acidimicrobiia bacterium]
MSRVSSQSERGATAILVALSLVLLLGFAALAVDGGAAFDDRRQQQSAADTGSLAAVQFANNRFAPMPVACTGSILQQSACRGADEAIKVVNGSLGNRFTLAQWSACVDSGDASYPVGSTLSDCISFTSNLKKARVLLPTTAMNTTFGRVIGTASININAFSEAGADLNSNGDVIPFALGPSASASSHACVLANSTDNLDVAPCNGPVEGNFGFLDITLYGNPEMGTGTTCSGDTQGRLATNLALGSDHELGIWNTGDPVRNDTTFCPVFTAQPNEVPTQTGGSNTGLENGLLRGINPNPTAEGRLACKDGDPNEIHRFPKTSVGTCVTVMNALPETLDNSPLWFYLVPSGASFAGPACANPDSRQEMELCLIAWKAAAATSSTDPPLFDLDILESPRFAAVPDLQLDPSNGTGNYLILGFKPVYLETLYLGCNANTCDVVYSPGESSSGACPGTISPTINHCGTPANGNKNLRAVTSFILELGMLDPELTDHWPSRPGVIEFNLIK